MTRKGELKRKFAGRLAALVLAATPPAALGRERPNIVFVLADDLGYGDGHLVVERNGDVYPCDFFVSPETRLGNVMSSGWRALRESPAARDFAARKCARHLSRLPPMAFYDRIAGYAAHPIAAASQTPTGACSRDLI